MRGWARVRGWVGWQCKRPDGWGGGRETRTGRVDPAQSRWGHVRYAEMGARSCTGRAWVALTRTIHELEGRRCESVTAARGIGRSIRHGRACEKLDPVIGPDLKGGVGGWVGSTLCLLKLEGGLLLKRRYVMMSS